MECEAMECVLNKLMAMECLHSIAMECVLNKLMAKVFCAVLTVARLEDH